MPRQEIHSGDSSQNVQFGGIGNGNTINISQNSHQINGIKLEIVEGSIKSISKRELLRKSILGLVKIFFFGAIGYLADIIGIAQHYNISYWWLIIIGSILGILLSFDNIRSLIYLLNIPKEGLSAFVGLNEIIEQSSEKGKVQIYHRSASCIYPYCKGKIIIVNAPPREKGKLGSKYVGICSIGRKDHSYRIDFNWYAMPELFDWRPIEEK